MKKRLIWIAILVFSVVGFASESPAFAAEKDLAGVRAAAGQFYAALNGMFAGELRPMEEIWS